MQRPNPPRRTFRGPAAATPAGLPAWLAALSLSVSMSIPLTGCNYASNGPIEIPDGSYTPGALPTTGLEPSPSAGATPGPMVGGRPVTDDAAPAGKGATAAAAGAQTPAAESATPDAPTTEERRAAILNNVIQLIQSASINPGGQNFGIAIQNLNEYFAGTPAPAYALGEPAREYLKGQVPPEVISSLQSTSWTMPDARHVEDCMFYRNVAARVAGTGDDLTRAVRVFQWMVDEVQLVPAGSLGSAQLRHAYARPYDVLLRGMGTESEGVWSERGWLFLALCRQLNLDGGLITYTPPGQKAPVVWCVAILVDDTPYLFDPRVGLPIPGPGGKGVATLDDALNDPAVLDRMDLPGQFAYGTTRDALRGSTTKLGVLIDSSTRYFAPRMRLLQQSLGGKNLTVLFRDPADQRDHWAKALGPRLGEVNLWSLPMTVEARLFQDPEFVAATQQALFMFRSEFPLLYARMKQLRGEMKDAVEDFVKFRFAENGTLMDGKTPMPPEVQKALDIYSTYFLGLAHLDLKLPDKAEFFFEKTLQLLPEPSRGQPFYCMYRWGAQANLARLREARGDTAKAIAYYSAKDSTSQRHGNLLKARDLLWPNPLAPCPDPLPPAPSPLPVPDATGGAPPAEVRQ